MGRHEGESVISTDTVCKQVVYNVLNWFRGALIHKLKINSSGSLTLKLNYKFKWYINSNFAEKGNGKGAQIKCNFVRRWVYIIFQLFFLKHMW